MTNKINLIINLSILALLIYLAVSVKQLQGKMSADTLLQDSSKQETEYVIRTLLNHVLDDIILEYEDNE